MQSLTNRTLVTLGLSRGDTNQYASKADILANQASEATVRLLKGKSNVHKSKYALRRSNAILRKNTSSDR